MRFFQLGFICEVSYNEETDEWFARMNEAHNFAVSAKSEERVIAKLRESIVSLLKGAKTYVTE
jgi:hypothetical protein